MKTRFADRKAAGRLLGSALRAKTFQRPVVYGLPRGGVPVAFEVAKALQAPLDILVVRKIGVPGHEELSMGAVGHDGVLILNDTIIRQLGIDQRTLDLCARAEARNVARLEKELRGNRTPLKATGRDVILVDDGLATGATMKAAVAMIKQQRPQTITVAVPVAPKEVCDRLGSDVDEVVALLTAEHFVAVGFWYYDFDQTSTDEVRRLLGEDRETRDYR